MAHLVKPWITRSVLDGKRVPAGTPGARIVRKRGRKWYAAGPPFRRDERIPLCADRTAALRMMADLVTRRERGEAGLDDTYVQARRLPLTQHLADWQAALEADPDLSARRVRAVTADARRVAEGCGWKGIDDLDAGVLAAWLARLRRGRAIDLDARDWWTPRDLAAVLGLGSNIEAVRQRCIQERLPSEGERRRRRYPRSTAEALAALYRRGKSVQRTNDLTKAVRQFAGWLVEVKRLSENPLARATTGNAELDRRRVRREVTVDELARLLESTRTTPDVFEDLAGPDRVMLYLTAFGTGFRRSEVAALTPAWFDLSGEPPTVRLPRRLEKARRGARQALPRGLAVLLANYLRGRDPAAPVWPGGWRDRAAEMLRFDLERASVPYVVDGPDGPEYADFHALRHTYVSAMGRSGATVRETQLLARHADPRLTLNVYSHAELDALGRAVDRIDLPGLSGPDAVRAPTREELAAGYAVLWELLRWLLAPAATVAPGVAPGTETTGDNQVQ